MLTRFIACYHCEGENVLNNAKAPNAKQKYLCHDCGSQSREDPGSKAYAPQKPEEILSPYPRSAPASELLRAPSGFRAAPSRVGSKKPLVCRLWSAPPTARAVFFAERESHILELLRALVLLLGRKADKRWVWIALARHTRQVLAYLIGERSERTTSRRLWERIPESYTESCKGGCCYRDFWEAYGAVIPEECHEAG